MSRRSLSSVTAALPAGAVGIGAGLVVAGLTAYGFLALAGRALGPEKFGSLAALWALMLVVGPGVFFPLEQELARALAARREQGDPGGLVARRILGLGAMATTALVLVTAAAFPVVVSNLFDGNAMVGVALLLVVPASLGQHTARGVLAAEGRFAAYGMLLAGEGVLRLLGAIVLVVADVDSAGPFALVVGIAPILVLLTVPSVVRQFSASGGPVRWQDLSSALMHLLGASVASQLLINIGPVVVKALATDREEAAVGRFFAALLVTRIPLYFIGSIQATVLPRLARLVENRQLAAFRSTVLGIGGSAVAVGASVAGVAVVVGPTVLPILFGDRFLVSRVDLALLGLATVAAMAALILAQGLVALRAYSRLTVGWSVGVLAMAATILVPGPAVIRVERGLAVGALVAAGALFALLLRESRAAEAGTGRGSGGMSPTSVGLEL